MFIIVRTIFSALTTPYGHYMSGMQRAAAEEYVGQRCGTSQQPLTPGKLNFVLLYFYFGL